MKVGAKYANRKNGHVVVIDEVSDKFPTVAIMNLDGSNRHKVNKSSFQKSYKLLEDAEKSQDDAQSEKAETSKQKPEKSVKSDSSNAGKQSEKSADKKEQKNEQKPATKSPEKSPESAEKPEKKSEKTEKKAEKAEAKPSKSKKQKSGLSEDQRIVIRDELVEAVRKLGITAFVPEKYPMWISVAFSENGKVVFGLAFNATHLRMRAKADLLPKDTEFKSVKGGFDATINLDYANKDKFVKIVTYAVENFKDSDIVTRKRKSKKQEVKAEAENK